MKNVKKHLCSMLRVVMPCFGFALICMGAYLLSQQGGNDDVDSWALILAYVLMVSGFLAIFVGVIWSFCHHMKSKVYRRRRLQHDIQVYTIERRPNSFPPAYEESQGSHQSPHPGEELVLEEVQVILGLAPPLYSQDSAQSPDCTWSWEQPPPYSLYPEERTEASFGMCG
ncbi:transmembrane protein 252-like [Entelurus aequoreus]|uniref:transmembrane protein 252-like n=1 Tax=Entelurus aequoreus TaxID=161455 RepID=UPI002B1CEF71|nr:transmembrane protein 252-like [Entelurus aequoreus]